MNMVPRDFVIPGCIEGQRAQVQLKDGWFRDVHGTNRQTGESGLRRRKGHRLEKSAEALEDAILRKILAPDVQISLIRHIETL